ncbi:hypothetical protein HYQ46_008745 [Verticillium longisporum]|nr:hypothetical protein HYQ46_008745 [Verticillium longisporum]
MVDFAGGAGSRFVCRWFGGKVVVCSKEGALEVSQVRYFSSKSQQGLGRQMLASRAMTLQGTRTPRGG